MNRITKYLLTIAITIFINGLATISVFAQDPQDPSINTGTNGGSTGVVGAGAALTSGMYLLIFLGGTYGIYKIYQLRKKKTAAATDMKA